MIFALVFVSLTANVHGAVQKGGVNPIEKVIEMIGDLEQKTIKEGEAAQKTYDEFAEWCEDESKNLQFDIKTAKGEVEGLTATIDKAASDIADEEEIIGQLTSQISTDEA